MSSCPTKDIHSVYLDNELPLSYVKEYEAHIQSCPKCSKELERIKKLHQVMTMNGEHELSQFEMDEGFKRLQIRMSYSKHTKNVSGMGNNSFASVIKYAVPAMAAAAVFAVVLPVGIKKTDKTGSEEMAAAPVITSLPLLTGSTVNTNSSMSGFSGNRNPMMRNGNIPQVVDVFRPNFDNENTISIKITIPGINAVPYTTEIDVPVEMYKGSLSETN